MTRTTITGLATRQNHTQRVVDWFQPHCRELNRNLAIAGSKVRFQIDQQKPDKARVQFSNGGLGFIEFQTLPNGQIEFDVRHIGNMKAPPFPRHAESAEKFFSILCEEITGTLLPEKDRLLLDTIPESGPTRWQEARGRFQRTAEILGLHSPSPF